MFTPPGSDSSATFSVIRRATVIVPPLRDFYFTRHRFSSLGATIVANLLKKHAIAVEYFNFPLRNSKGTVVDLPADLKYLDPFLIEGETGRVSFFTSFRHFGLSIDDCANAILTGQPDICFFSVFAFCYADAAITLASTLKRMNPSLPLAVGGPGAGVYPGYFLKKNAFDYVFSGDAEVSLPRFIDVAKNAVHHLDKPLFQKELNAGFRTIPNLFWYENGKILSSELTASAEEGTMDFAIIKTAESAQTTTFSTMISRGCPRNCSFCSSRLTSGNAFRRTPCEKIDHALSSLVPELIQDGRAKRIIINIEDDNFLADREYFLGAVGVFKRHFPEARFIAENGIDHSFLTPAACEWLLSLGMMKFNLSLASLDPGILFNANRFIDRDGYEKCIDFLFVRNIPTITYCICGLKNDTLETASFNLSYLAGRNTLAGISLFYAVPGLPGFTDMELFDGKSSSRCCGSAAFPWNGSLSTETMITAFRLSRFSNLKKNAFITEKEKELMALVSNKEELYTIVKEKKGHERIVSVGNQDKDLVKKYFKSNPL